MNPNLERKLLETEYYSLSAILRQRSLDYIELTDDELSAMSVVDLRAVVGEMRFVARTPPA